MPTYDYLCSLCQHHVEIFQKITDDPLVCCPSCNQNGLVRQFGTGAAIVFKGSGFYQTDYRSESYKKAATAESKPVDSGSKSENSTSASASSKPTTSSTSAS